MNRWDQKLGDNTETGRPVSESVSPANRVRTMWYRGVGIWLMGAILAGFAEAEVAPAKPYADVVAEVVAFLFADAGTGGIRTNDDDPGGYPVPPYFYHYAIDDANDLWGNINGYPFYRSVSYPGYTASVAIDAFLDWRRWSGDDEGLVRARQFADWVLEHRTPAGDLYANLPYSTQTDGVMGGGWDGPAIMTDKPPMIAVRLLRLHDITGDPAYLAGALEIADVMAATQLAGGVVDDGRWPFRVVPGDGTVTQDYTSNLQPALRLFSDLAERTGVPAYVQARDRVWNWLLANPCDPASASYMRWEGFYEDQDPGLQTGKGDHYSAHEMVLELVERRPSGWRDMAVAIFDSMSARYLVQGAGTAYAQYEPVTLEWTGWPEATYAASLQYARTALVLDQALAGDPRHDPAWRSTALSMAAVCSHGQNDQGIAADGRMFTTLKDLLFDFNDDSWYEQNFNTVKYFLEIMGLEPDLAPSGEGHVLTTDRALTMIDYSVVGPLVRYATSGGGGRETVKLGAKPLAVRSGGGLVPELGSPPQGADGWFWDTATNVATIVHSTGPVEVLGGVSGVGDAPEPGAGAALQLQGAGAVGAGRIAIDVGMARGGLLTVGIYDLRGHRVGMLAEAAWMPAGRHELVWDGRDEGGRLVASGVYLVRGDLGPARAATRVLWLR